MRHEEEPTARRDPPGERQFTSGNTRPFGRVDAVFLDRDGVISEQTAFVNRPEELVLIDGAAEAIARLNRAGLPIVVITNQGGIAMGHLTEETLGRIHERLERLLADADAHVDAIYHCPHMPNATVTKYLKDCPCRKPRIGMFERASEKLGIDPRRSYMVGDATTDILAGQRAGCFTILVETGFAGKDGKAIAVPDLVVPDLQAAADYILRDLQTKE